jgi:Tfp pilus assembly protein PilE
MKKELLKGFTMLTLMVVLALATAVASANAQSPHRVVADIPFDFSVGYKIMPAGGYTVRTVSTTGNSLMIQTADGRMAAVRLSDETERAKNIPPARLVFHRYGERYFLAEVWNGFDKTGRQLLKSQEESSLGSELARISAKTETAKNTYETVEVLAVPR